MLQEPATVGFISPPAWFDPSPAEFSTLTRYKARCQQTIVPLPDFDYSLPSLATGGEAMATAAKLLAEVGCTTIGQVGSPFSWAGDADEAEARTRQQQLSDAAGRPVLMTGLAMVDGLRALKAQRIVICCSYYDQAWKEACHAFFSRCGFTIAGYATFTDQGLYSNRSILDLADHRFCDAMVSEHIERTLGTAGPDADAIVITGAGVRTLRMIEPAEKQFGLPIVSADAALYWAMLKEMKMTKFDRFGQLSALV